MRRLWRRADRAIRLVRKLSGRLLFPVRPAALLLTGLRV